MEHLGTVFVGIKTGESLGSIRWTGEPRHRYRRVLGGPVQMGRFEFDDL